MHALWSVSSHLSHLRGYQGGTEQSPRPHRADARHRRRPAGTDQDVRRGNVFLSGLSGVHDSLSGGGELRGIVRARPRRSRAQRRLEIAGPQLDSWRHASLAVHGFGAPATGGPGLALVPGTWPADFCPSQRFPETVSPTSARTGSDDTAYAGAVFGRDDFARDPAGGTEAISSGRPDGVRPGPDIQRCEPRHS